MNLGQLVYATSTADVTGIGAGPTQISWDTVSYDGDGTFASNVWTPGFAGLYLVGTTLVFDTITTQNVEVYVGFYTSGAASLWARDRRYSVVTSTGRAEFCISCLLSFAASSNVSVYCGVSAGTMALRSGTVMNGKFWGYRVA